MDPVLLLIVQTIQIPSIYRALDGKLIVCPRLFNECVCLSSIGLKFVFLHSILRGMPILAGARYSHV